jgi:hypothetical protein
LQNNLGKDVSLVISETRIIQGKLFSASADVIIVRNGDGVTAMSPNQVQNVTINGSPKIDIPHYSSHRALEVRTEGSKAGRLYMIGLEKGLTWSPSYSLDITDGKKLTFVSKAVLLDDLDEIKDVETRLVTGFPNVYFLPVVDPLLAANTVEDYIRSIGMADAALNARSNGFGGMGGQSAGSMSQATLPESFVTGNIPGSMDHDNPAGLEEGDLFFYRQPHVTMAKGDRSYYILSDAKLDYKEVYTWDSADTINNDSIYDYGRSNQPQPLDEVWHSLQFKNGVGQPLTTGPATTFKGGELMGQDMLKYTSVGSEALVKITKALDIHAESADEETDRKRGALQVPGSGAFDLVSLKTVLKATNTKKESVHMKITRPYTGDLIDADGATVTKNLKGLRRINPTGKLVWERDVQPGKTLTLTVITKVYVRSGG